MNGQLQFTSAPRGMAGLCATVLVVPASGNPLLLPAIMLCWLSGITCEMQSMAFTPATSLWEAIKGSSGCVPIAQQAKNTATQQEQISELASTAQAALIVLVTKLANATLCRPFTQS